MGKLKRVCMECNKSKPIEKFPIGGGFHRRRCITCWRHKTRSRYHQDVSARASAILATKKYRCKKLGIPYNLDKKWFMKKIEAGKCEATGLDLVVDTDENLGYHTPWAPSIDRIDMSGGYLKENCRVVCNIFNLAKNAFDDPDVYRMAKAFVTRYESQLKKAA